MVMATFRFHGNLNDFLKPKHRHQAFDRLCAQSATTKHMIEALGVPHTEVGQVAVNHAEANLSQLIMEGDYISVYPVTGASHAESCHVPSDYASLNFIADSHLGGLGRLLRMAGFNTLYDNHFDDHEIIEIAHRENRIVLTRDRELLKRRDLIVGSYIRALKPPEQLREVVERYRLANQAAPFTLCLHCNKLLQEVDKASIYHRLPPSVQKCQHEFSLCSCCNRVYWKGTHWQRMRAMINEIVLSESLNLPSGLDR
jgi:uncharacterized protein with PIN domain